MKMLPPSSALQLAACFMLVSCLSLSLALKMEATYDIFFQKRRLIFNDYTALHPRR
jgi:hypothetical protein